MNKLKNKKILVCITGSIAAYKSCEFIRIIRKMGMYVQVVMSAAAQEFIGKATLAALSNNEVMYTQFSDNPEAGLKHVEFAIDYDAIVVIPATANILCKAANGVADDLVSTCLSICNQPTIYAPAMNFRMWQNKSTIDAVDKLREMGKVVMNPEEGKLASLHKGEGRLPQINNIVNELQELFKIQLPLKNKKVTITAGPTKESIDPIRYLSNRSSGKMGYAIAQTCRDLGAEVTLISGPVSIDEIVSVNTHKIESADEMLRVLNENLDTDYIFMCAAVSDYKIKKIKNHKIKRSNKGLTLELTTNPDIIKSIGTKTKAKKIAFALETDHGKENAIKKLKEKNVDYIVLNYANEKGAGFDSNTNHIYVYNKNGKECEFKKDTKERIAKKLVNHIINE